MQCYSLKTHAHFTDKIAKLISEKYDFINKYDRQYHQFDIYVKLLHNYDKSPTNSSCLIWVTVFFLLDLSARDIPYEYDSRGQCILCMLENIFNNFKNVVWRVLAFSLRIIFKFEPPMTAYMFYSAQTLEMLCSLMIESDYYKKASTECWDEKHIKICDNKTCLELGNPNCCLKGRYWTDVSNRSFKNISAASCKILHWPNLSIHFCCLLLSIPKKNNLF